MCTPKDAVTPEFHKCCGQCGAAKKAAKEGKPVEPHEPCDHTPRKPAGEPQPK